MNYKIVYEHLQQYPHLSIVQCIHCDHIYTFSKENQDPDKLYSTEAYKMQDNKKTFFDKLLRWEHKNILKRIDRLKPAKGNLLDFGCGKGKFASVVQQNGWVVKGVETATERAEYAKNILRLDVSTHFYSKGKIFTNEFDVLTLFHVLEHLPASKTLLSELIKHNLTKDGLVVIEVPNFKSLQRKIAGKRWLHLDPSRHISHFTPVELNNISKELNLQPARTGSFSYTLGILGMTDSLLKLFGYRKNIIEQLKNKKSIGLKIGIAFLLPLAFVLESIASVTGNGGITRKYFLRSN